MSDHSFSIGDRVRVKLAIHAFGDYKMGDTAVIESIDRDGDLHVVWDEAIGTPEWEKNGRLTMVFSNEIELVGCAGTNFKPGDRVRALQDSEETDSPDERETYYDEGDEGVIVRVNCDNNLKRANLLVRWEQDNRYDDGEWWVWADEVEMLED